MNDDKYTEAFVLPIDGTMTISDADFAAITITYSTGSGEIMNVHSEGIVL